ncbi:fibronectin type III domain-containing protein [Actinoplanes sp. NPDC049548]|uniref:fibronectin type III domain-containing protein n=1 Tax=Actinoplanes sp. NPDC049548 TaxID=3155152 RepID=UPI00342BDD53
MTSAIGVATPMQAMAAGSVPTAPTGLSAVRSVLDVRDFTVSWTSATGPVDHYVVSMFADGKRSRYTVPSTATSFAVDGSGLMTIYQVRVTAENAASMGTTSDELTVNPVLAGPPVNVWSASLPGGGIKVNWSAPSRTGLNPTLNYQVSFVDVLTRAKTTYTTSGTSLGVPGLDTTRVYDVSVAAVTRDGAGLVETARIGGDTPTAPRWFTAVRDPEAPEKIVLSWTEPSWAGSSAVTGYLIGSGKGTVSTWVDAGDVTTATLSLPAKSTGVYSVRAVNNAGQSVDADIEFVDVAVRTPLVSSAYPITVTSSGHDVTVNLHNDLATSQDQLTICLLPGEGWTYRDERTVTNGSELAVSFDNVPSGRYRLWVLGRNSKDPKDHGSELFNEEVFVNDGALTMSSVGVSFVEGTADWHGVYPATSLPVVLMTDKIAYDGSTSMAVTATKDSIGNNITASPGLARAIPTVAGQQVVVSAQGFATTQATQWNLGVAWWNAKGEKIAVTRTKRLRKTVGDWKPSGGTFTAPAGAVSAGPFLEVGELLRGQSFYLDDIALRSFTPSSQLLSAADWILVKGQAQISDATVQLSSYGDAEVLDARTPGADLTLNTSATLKSGSGYGVVLRATREAQGTSGYVVQLVKSNGQYTYVLRKRQAGKTCTTSLATSNVVQGLSATTAHKLTLKISGDALTVTAAGKLVLVVNSLATAGQGICGPTPTGTAIALLKTGGAAADFVGTALAKN